MKAMRTTMMTKLVRYKSKKSAQNKLTSEFVKAFPMGRKNKQEIVCSVAPSTPGRPVFRFSGGGGGACNFARKSVPSKWDDALKWLVRSSCHESPAHASKNSESSKKFEKNDGDTFAQKLRVDQEKVGGFQKSLVSLNSSEIVH